ncbi:hypothetical protein [Nocardia xishanensis]|uniref:Uncharacterized protein n=1 Tax=Nocardia xishanensis TaxID=238964 RepID=A0ABW7XB75_9NOCA
MNDIFFDRLQARAAHLRRGGAPFLDLVAMAGRIRDGVGSFPPAGAGR